MFARNAGVQQSEMCQLIRIAAITYFHIGYNVLSYKNVRPDRHVSVGGQPFRKIFSRTLSVYNTVSITNTIQRLQVRAQHSPLLRTQTHSKLNWQVRQQQLIVNVDFKHIPTRIRSTLTTLTSRPICIYITLAIAMEGYAITDLFLARAVIVALWWIGYIFAVE